MKTINFIVLLIILTSCSVLSVNARACGSGWNEFFSEPNEKHYDPIVLMLKNNSLCRSYFSENNSVVNNLIKLNLEENLYSLKLSVSALQYLGGGNKEDIIRSISSLLDNNAELFLRVTASVNIRSKYFKPLVSMLSLNSVDNLSDRIGILESRIFNLSKVKSDDERIGKAINIIMQYKAMLEKIMRAQDK